MSMPNESKFVIDFDKELPPWNFFPIAWCANEWHCSPEHIVNLIETGELPVGVDLRGHKSSKMMIRIPRKSLVAFLNHRKNLEAVAAANPRPKTREERRRQKGKR
jgi:hypothetical protein